MIKGSIQEEEIITINIKERYTLMAESEEELKSLMMKVKEESQKVA